MAAALPQFDRDAIGHHALGRFGDLLLATARSPAMLFYLDRDYHEFNGWFNVKLKKEPSEYVLEHALFGMIGDALIVQMGDIFPLDQLVWGIDFPHSVGTYPNSKEYIAKTFVGIDEGLRRKILVENICNHLGLDANATITETPPE